MRLDRLTASLAATLCLVLCAPQSSRANFAGGGKKKTDCYLEFNIEGDSAVKKGTLKCIDGDPACDTDGACDKKCTFKLGLCANQTDVAGCTSPGLSSGPIVKGAAPNAPALTGANCGDQTDVAVAL